MAGGTSPPRSGSNSNHSRLSMVTPPAHTVSQEVNDTSPLILKQLQDGIMTAARQAMQPSPAALASPLTSGGSDAWGRLPDGSHAAAAAAASTTAHWLCDRPGCHQTQQPFAAAAPDISECVGLCSCCCHSQRATDGERSSGAAAAARPRQQCPQPPQVTSRTGQV